MKTRVWLARELANLNLPDAPVVVELPSGEFFDLESVPVLVHNGMIVLRSREAQFTVPLGVPGRRLTDGDDDRIKALRAKSDMSA